MDRTENSLKKGLLGLLIFLLLLTAIFFLKGYFDGHFQSAESFQAYVATFGILGPLVLTAVQALQVILPVLPGFLGCIVGAGMFGAWGGFLCNYIGICAGSLIAFFLARRFGVSLVRKLVPMEKYRSFVAWINRKRSFTLVLALCILLPLAPDDFLCYLSGLMKYSARKFVWIILLMKPWCILLYCLFFAHII